jgi:hydroxyacylglutathione hydrolase
MHVFPLRTPSLGDASYLLSHGGSGIIVDPQRDIRRFLDLINEEGITVTHVVDTHVHNDYLSGAPALARHLHADLVLPAASGAAFPFVPAFHMEDLAGESGLTIRPIHTPGHTPEHTSYLVLVDGRPTALFSGGSLLVGAAGRTDLLGDDLADSLARLQYRSVNRLARLPGAVGLYPTHGEGSFCAASGAGRQTSTIEQERVSSPVLAAADEDEFVRTQLGGLLPYPDYYPSMAPINVTGPDAIVDPSPSRLDATGTKAAIAAGAEVVDARARHAYAAGHYPGSLNVELGDSFAPWVGWLVPFGTPVLLVLDTEQDPEWAAVELGRIGYEVAGVVLDPAHLPELTTSATATVADLERVIEDGATVIDVRDPAEWRSGHLAGSSHRYVPDLRDGIPEGASDDVWTVCASGQRASIAAGLIERHGVTPTVVAAGGVSDLLRRRPDLAA